MMAPWQYADPAPPPAGDAHYTRDAVAEAERWAWAGELRGRRAEFFYDGFECWRQLRSGERQAVLWLDAPADGWWHKPNCNCVLCVARVSPARTRQGIGTHS